MAEHQSTTEHSVSLSQLQALRHQGAIGEKTFAQLKAKLLSGNAQDVQGAQKDIQTLQAPPDNTNPPAKKKISWLFKLFALAVLAVVVTIIYLVVQMPKHDAEASMAAPSGTEENVEILLPKGAQDVVPTFTPGESINEAFKAKQAAQDGLLSNDRDDQVATSPTPQPQQTDAGSTQKTTSATKEHHPISEPLKNKPKDTQTKPAPKKAVAAENIDNLF